MKDRKLIISNFINSLRFKHRKQVKQIILDTSLSRMTILQLEKRERSITDHVWSKFEKAYGKDFLDFAANFSEDTPTVIKEPEPEYKSDISELAAAIAELSLKYTESVDRWMESVEENNRLKKEIANLRAIITRLESN